jgi:hypothetical protein
VSVMHPTTWWTPRDDQRLRCDVCPRACALHEGQTGLCFMRMREPDQIVLTTYGRSSGFRVDPIEKKPLNHTRPSSKGEERSLLVDHERLDLLVPYSQETNDIVGRTVAQSYPDNFRWWPVQNAEPMKVLVLAHDHESIITRVAPDRTVGGGRQRYIADMGRTGIQIVERCYEARCEILVEEQLRALLRQPDYSRSGARGRRQTLGTRGCPRGQAAGSRSGSRLRAYRTQDRTGHRQP